MAGLILKVKSKAGQKVLNTLTTDNTLHDLKRQLCLTANIPVNHLHVLYGFPPRAIDLGEDNKLLKDCDIKTGDTLIVDEKQSEVKKSTDDSYDSLITKQTISKEIDPEYPGVLMKQVVPADNSCLFTSIHFVLNGKVDESGEVAPWMRQIISETIARDTETYSEALLGKPNLDYCKWILDSKSWGGAIELSILSNYYGIEIDVVDTVNAIINRFGEDQHYGHRVLLLFDGIHYDPLYLEPLGGEKIQTIFPTEDERILREAEQLAKEAKSSRQFTDVNKFTLKCLVCNILLNGQTQAQQHAQSTGHANFGEV